MSALEQLPWHIKVDALGYPSIYGTNEDGGEGDLIAHCFADYEHLIRTAPELLRAAERMIVATEADQHFIGAEHDALLAAIAKARGQ